MSPFISRLGDFFHLHPLSYFLTGGRASDISGSRDAVGATDHRVDRVALAHLGLGARPRSSSADAALGRFALLSGDDEHRARVDDLWHTCD